MSKPLFDKSKYIACDSALGNLQRQLKELQAKYEKCVEALRFYADEKNNTHVSSMFSSISDTDTNVSNDAGKLARQVLKECEEM